MFETYYNWVGESVKALQTPFIVDKRKYENMFFMVQIIRLAATLRMSFMFMYEVNEKSIIHKRIFYYTVSFKIYMTEKRKSFSITWISFWWTHRSLLCLSTLFQQAMQMMKNTSHKSQKRKVLVMSYRLVLKS